MTSGSQQNQASSGFSVEWDKSFGANTHLSKWPWSDLVSSICRYASPRESFLRVLEVGCGAGANIPFFLDRGCDYHAIEGSPVIVGRLKERFPHLSEKIVCGDFTKTIPFDTEFDLIVDRSAITHNDTASIAACLGLLARKTRPGGLFVGIDWFSTAHSDSRRGAEVDSHTRRDIDSRTFGGVGRVHFSDRAHLTQLIREAGFEVRVLEHKTNETLVGEVKETHASFNVIAVRS
jgi:SAM-dependent methyltransferase